MTMPDIIEGCICPIEATPAAGVDGGWFYLRQLTPECPIHDRSPLDVAEITQLKAEIDRWKAGDDTWRALAFAYVNAEPGSDHCAQAWHEMEAAVRHYEAVERRTGEAAATPTGEGPPRRARVSTEIRFLLWSNRYQKWWAPNSLGYTHDIDEAGRYSEAEAISRVVKSAYYGRRDQVTCMIVDPGSSLMGYIWRDPRTGKETYLPPEEVTVVTVAHRSGDE